MVMWNLMLEFYAKYPQYSKLDLYIIGESYAGHYVPAIGKAIFARNSIYPQNLKGILLLAMAGWTHISSIKLTIKKKKIKK